MISAFCCNLPVADKSRLVRHAADAIMNDVKDAPLVVEAIMRPEKVQKTVRIPTDLNDRLTKLAPLVGETSEAIITRALRRELDRLEAPHLPLSWDDPLLAQRYLECVPAPVVIKDSDACILWCNLAYEALFRRGRDEIRGKSVTGLVDPIAATTIKKNIKALQDLRDRKRATESWEVIATAGRRKLFRTLRFVFSQSSGTNPLLGDLSFDWNKSKPGKSGPLGNGLEERLRDCAIHSDFAETFRSCLIECPAAIAIKDRETKMLWCNAAYEKLFEKKLSDIKGQSTREIYRLQPENPIVQTESQVIGGNQWRFAVETLPGKKARTNLRFPIPGVDGAPAFLGVVSEDEEQMHPKVPIRKL